MASGSDLGQWLAVEPSAGAAWLSGLGAPWWIAGGWALDLFVGERTRPHHDLDIGVLRRDMARVRDLLQTWEMFEAKDGRLTRLGADLPRADVHSLWCRPAGAERWTLQLMLDDSDGDDWIYRREPSIRRPLANLVARSEQGLPYLLPEVQLLYKARRVRPRDRADFDRVAWLLARPARDWLRAALLRAEPGHPWLAELG